MEDLKATKLNIKHVEETVKVTQEQLALQGEETEALEKTYGIWKSVNLNRSALASSVSSLLFLGVFQLINIQC